MKYWISYKEFTQGHQASSWDDDNNGKGYQKNEAKQKAKQSKLNGGDREPLSGVEAKVYSWDGNLA